MPSTDVEARAPLQRCPGASAEIREKGAGVWCVVLVVADRGARHRTEAPPARVVAIEEVVEGADRVSGISEGDDASRRSPINERGGRDLVTGRTVGDVSGRDDDRRRGVLRLLG